MEFHCPTCNKHFVLPSTTKELTPQYCPYCGNFLNLAKAKTIPLGESKESLSESSHITLVKGHYPKEENIQFTIGPYQVIRSIGKGGMGEVFLAYDTTCGRRIALKRIRTDLVIHKQLHNRFLKEARVTSQLTHPSIIPIYAIQAENNLAYYTMPFVEGSTLKQILRSARKKEKQGEKPDIIGSSIPALIRIFLSVCQAIAYAHSKGVLHRDIKPENIIVGKYGEVLILDWGLAKLIKGKKEAKEEESFEEPAEESKTHPFHHLTKLGKVVGTIAYMAPERAMGHPATHQTDIYSLGVILYQILTLRPPFQRGGLKEFRQNIDHEVLYDPVDVAPYRDVPRMLSKMTLKCLNPISEHRYKTVDDLIHDLENYIEGRSEWFQTVELDINRKSDWEFQENVLIAEHIAITRGTEVSDWVSLMVSKESFPENTKIEAQVKIGDKGHGLGFLLNIPEAAERVHLNDGYCLWLGSDLNKSTKLLRSTVEVVHASDIFFQRHVWYHIRIEKIDQNIYFYLNDVLQFSYISHLPLAGTHVGLLSRDADFLITAFQVYVGSQSLKVNCLAVPDAFLAHKDYVTALSEYRRIGYSFPGTAEGREAMFRAGITLLEQAKNTNDKQYREELYEMALDEFGKLHATPGAPLEYLGKALVYQTLQDYEEEIKCFEMACRRYPAHPLLPVLQEQILYRMHENSRYNRKAAYNFILLVVEHLSKATSTPHVQKLFNNLQKYWEPLPFIQEDSEATIKLKNLHFGVQLAFWLAKPFVLIEFIDQMSNITPFPSMEIGNALYSLIELGCFEEAAKKLNALILGLEKPIEKPFSTIANFLRVAILVHEKPLQECLNLFFENTQQTTEIFETRVLFHIIQTALNCKQTDIVHEAVKRVKDNKIDMKDQVILDCFEIWAFLLEKNWDMAEAILHKYPLETLVQETTPLHFLYGCWLIATEGKDIAQIHFSGILEVSFPRTWTLGSHFINGHILENGNWFQKAFMWEKRQLYQQLTLYAQCIGNVEKSKEYQNLEKQEYIET